MQLFKLFAVPLFIFKFEEHHKYVFSDIDKIDNTPQGWKLSLNSTFPSIPDDDQLVPKNIRDNLMKDLGNQISSNLSEYNLPNKFKIKNQKTRRTYPIKGLDFKNRKRGKEIKITFDK